MPTFTPGAGSGAGVPRRNRPKMDRLRNIALCTILQNLRIEKKKNIGKSSLADMFHYSLYPVV